MLFELLTYKNKCFVTGLSNIMCSSLNLVSKVRLKTFSNLSYNIFISIFFSLCLSLSLSIGQTGLAQNTSHNYSAALFPTIDGTEVQILTDNFLGLVTTGRIFQSRLELNNKLIPTQKVQIIFSNAQTGEVGILPAIVDFEGNDLLIPVTSNGSPATTTYVSLHTWLLSTKGITLSVPIINN